MSDTPTLTPEQGPREQDPREQGSLEQGSLEQGLVYSHNRGQYQVHAAGRLLACALAPRLRDSALSPVVGDVVQVAPRPGGGQIVAVLPRRNVLARRSAVPMPSAHAHQQIIAANVDQVAAVMAAAQPAPKWNLLDRYLTLAEALELPAVVCVTKADLARPAGGLDAGLDEYARLGYAVVVTSAVTGQGLPALAQALHGRTTVLLGKSGTGKTSLLNALEPGLGQRVAEVSRATGKGRHTTSQAQLFALTAGGALVDTPGTREFGLWDLDPDDLALLFPEMRPWVGQCRFGLDCRHDQEPGCAIRAAVMRAAISPRRYQSYLRLRREL